MTPGDDGRPKPRRSTALWWHVTIICYITSSYITPGGAGRPIMSSDGMDVTSVTYRHMTPCGAGRPNHPLVTRHNHPLHVVIHDAWWCRSTKPALGWYVIHFHSCRVSVDFLDAWFQRWSSPSPLRVRVALEVATFKLSDLLQQELLVAALLQTHVQLDDHYSCHTHRHLNHTISHC